MSVAKRDLKFPIPVGGIRMGIGEDASCTLFPVSGLDVDPNSPLAARD